MKKEQKEKIVDGLHGLLFIVSLFLILLFAGIIIFFMHYPVNINELWNSNAGLFVFSLFSAFFSGLNVFAFILLTNAINRQKDQRQQDLTYYDGLKYKLECQNELLSKFDEMIPRYINANYFKQLKNVEDIKFSLFLMNQDMFTLYTIYGINKKETQNNIRMFYQVFPDDIDELQNFIFKLDKLLDKYNAKSFERQAYMNAIDEFFKKEAMYIPEDIKAIKEGILEDTQLVTQETLQIISKGESNIPKEPEETSQRYKNIQRRKSNK